MPDETPSRRRASRPMPRWMTGFGAADDLPIDPDLDPQDPAEPSRTHRPGRATPGRLRMSTLGAVFFGGALGTVARYGVERALPPAPGHFPVATFVINTSGAFLLGVVLTMLLERVPHLTPTLRPFLATGLLGGWTTYSSLVVESDSLLRGGHAAGAAGYVAVTLVCGVTATALGIALGRARSPRRPSHVPERSSR